MNAIEILRDHLNLELLKLMDPIEDKTEITLPISEIVEGYYDLTDMTNTQWLATNQPCFSDFSSRDAECKKCSLAIACKKSKGESVETSRDERSLKSEINNLFDSKMKRAVAKLSDLIPQEVVLKGQINCKITSVSLSEGETHLFYPEYGIVHILAKKI